MVESNYFGDFFFQHLKMKHCVQRFTEECLFTALYCTMHVTTVQLTDLLIFSYNTEALLTLKCLKFIKQISNAFFLVLFQPILLC